jgi:hypothetical protein
MLSKRTASSAGSLRLSSGPGAMGTNCGRRAMSVGSEVREVACEVAPVWLARWLRAHLCVALLVLLQEEAHAGLRCRATPLPLDESVHVQRLCEGVLLRLIAATTVAPRQRSERAALSNRSRGPSPSTIDSDRCSPAGLFGCGRAPDAQGRAPLEVEPPFADCDRHSAQGAVSAHHASLLREEARIDLWVHHSEPPYRGGSFSTRRRLRR